MKYILVVFIAVMICASLQAKHHQMNYYKPQKSHTLLDFNYICDNHYVHLLSNLDNSEYICYLVKLNGHHVRYLGPIDYDIACFHFPFLVDYESLYVGPRNYSIDID